MDYLASSKPYATPEVLSTSTSPTLDEVVITLDGTALPVTTVVAEAKRTRVGVFLARNPNDPLRTNQVAQQPSAAVNGNRYNKRKMKLFL